MDKLLQGHKTFHKSLLFIYSCIVLIWCVVIGLVFYRYVIFSSAKEVKKGGTFVEAIYNPISYLPYRGDQNTNLHYQTLLFHGCEGGTFDGICTLQTTDHKTYRVSIQNEKKWSDNTPITLSDVYFTYKTIVVDNIREQPYLANYKDIIITSEGSGILTFNFPFADKNNIDFFKLPILPKHVVQDKTVEGYVELFSSHPISSTCARLGDSNNEKNLIIDMTRCPESNINYYQLQSFNSYEKLIETAEKSKKFSVSLYKGPDALIGYSPIKALENTYTTMFFNTSSVRLSPRIQRALGGLIYKGLSQQPLTGYFSLYTGILSRHKSDGTNVGEYIISKNPLLDYDKQGLEKVGVKKLPENFTIEGSNIRQAYYIEGSNDTTAYKFTLNTIEQFSNTQARSDTSKIGISIHTSNEFRTHNVTLTLGGDKNTIRDGVNTLTIQGTQQGKLKTIAVIDIYYLGNKDVTKTQTLKVIYYKDPVSLYTIDLFKSILEKNNLTGSFEIKGYSDMTTFSEAINGKIYDIVFTPLSMNSTADIAAIITNENTEKNPSSYKNLTLAKMLEDYSNNPSNELKGSLQELFSTDMPFVILGQNRSQYWLKDTITFNSSGTINTSDLRKSLLLNANIVSHMSFRAGKMLEKDNRNAFVQSEQMR